MQKRREDREQEKEQREREQDQLARDRAVAEAVELEKKEDEVLFTLIQQWLNVLLRGLAPSYLVSECSKHTATERRTCHLQLSGIHLAGY